MLSLALLFQDHMILQRGKRIPIWGKAKMALDEGYTPMLYTNADYTASNACYEKIGYVLRGKLCTIG